MELATFGEDRCLAGETDDDDDDKCTYLAGLRRLTHFNHTFDQILLSNFWDYVCSRLSIVQCCQ